MPGELLGWAAGVGVALLPALFASAADSRDTDTLLVIGVIAAMFTGPAGITIAGNADAGHGDYGWTFLGHLLGAPLFLVGAPAFGVVGYEVSSSDRCTDLERIAHRGPTITPTVVASPSQRHLELGLSVAF